MVSTRNPRLWSMVRKHMWVEVYEPLVDDQWPHNPIFVENSHELPFSTILKANTYRNPRLWSMARKHMWGQVYEPLVDDQWPHNPHFLSKITFSIIPKFNTYRFLTKKWSPPVIQECDLRQQNICGVRCTSLRSTINGHTTPTLARMGVVWPLIVDWRLVHLTPHTFPCLKSDSRISSGDHFLAINL
jgi:hypothetical protein